jgi:predicted DNA-binding transcriptional regulator AlpA
MCSGIDLRTLTAQRLVRIAEIADLLGVSKQRAHQIADEEESPAPVGREGQSRLWDRREVTAWAKVWRREKPWR